MAWTNFPTSPQTYFYTGQLIAAADMNTYIRDNMNYLFSGRPAGFLVRVANYTFTNIAWADVDATNLILNVNTVSGRIYARAVIEVAVCNNAAGNYVAMDLILDGVTRKGDANYGLNSFGQTGSRTFVLEAYFSGLTPGLHTIKLQNKCGTASGGNIGPDGSGAIGTVVMSAWEY